MGDGMLAYFGWPRAHEDDARRAVSVALAIVHAVARLPSPTGEQFACRIGIATGLVVVGDLIGVGAAQEHAVVGSAPQPRGPAARGRRLGRGNDRRHHRRLLGGDFAIEDIGERRLKGHERPVLLFRVLRREARESRFAARGEESSVPIFGRDAELALLLQAWEKARSGRGQAVLLTGEAGIRKSRLLQAFAEATAAGLPTRHVFQCSPLHTDNPFWPVVLRFAPAAAIVARGTEDAGGGGRRKVRRNVVVALAAQLLAAAMPALLIFEDAQWADQATLELMRHLAGAVGDAPVLLIVTDRPEAEAHLGMATNLTRLELARLDGPTSVGLITAVAGRCQLAPRLRGDIVARSDGIPLFLEEMTRAVLEAAPADGEIAVPATLRDSQIARLDVAPARAG